MPDSALNRRSEALGGWKANNASFGHQIIPRTQFGNSPVIDFGSELVHAGNGQYDSWWQTFGTWL